MIDVNQNGADIWARIRGVDVEGREMLDAWRLSDGLRPWGVERT